MTPPRLRHCRTAWVTLVTLVLAAVAPAVSHSLSRVRAAASPWDEVCSTRTGGHQGLGGPAPAAPLHPHCAYCTTLGGAQGLPPTPGMSIAAPVRSQAMALRALSAPRVQAAWSSAQPRAPPRAGRPSPRETRATAGPSARGRPPVDAGAGQDDARTHSHSHALGSVRRLARAANHRPP